MRTKMRFYLTNKQKDIEYKSESMKSCRSVALDHEEGLLAGLMRELSKKELSDLILTNQESMYRMAVSMLGSDADAQDAVSESITRAFEKQMQAEGQKERQNRGCWEFWRTCQGSCEANGVG